MGFAHSSRVRRLIDQLARLGVESKNSIAEAVEAQRPAVLQVERVKVAGQHLIRPDLLIVDSCTGSLGLVYFIPYSGDAAAFRSAIERRIDEAAYVRHLFLSDHSANDCMPWAVETVLVTDPALHAEIGAVFRATSTETDFLYSIGINHFEWPAEWTARKKSPGGTAEDDNGVISPERTNELQRNLRRAFAWLMSGVREWFEQIERDAAKRRRKRKPKHLEQLVLNDYRLPGKRVLKLAWKDGQDEPPHGEPPPSQQRHDILQLVYGRNGSGKSSFVEALEYAVTGKITRLEEVSDDGEFRRTIVNRRALSQDTDAAAQVELHVSWLKRPIKLQLKSREHNNEKLNRIDPLSFRLDQTAMDRLMNATAADRTTLFLRAFFPDEERQLQEAVNTARSEAQKELLGLPTELRELLQSDQSDSLKSDLVSAKLGWLNSKKQINPDVIRACVKGSLGVTLDELSALSILDSRIEGLTKLIRNDGLQKTQFLSAMTALEEILGPFIANGEKSEKLAEVMRIVEMLSDWFIPETASGSSQGFVADLNLWLESLAAADLANRNLQVATVVRIVQRSDQEFPGEQPPNPFGHAFPVADPEKSGLKRWRDDLRQQVKEAYKRLPRTIEDVSVENDTDSDVAHIPSLTREQIGLLDAVSADARKLCNVPEDDKVPPLGEAIVQAIHGHNPVHYGHVPIGDPGWAELLLKPLRALDGALKLLLNGRREGGIITKLERVLQAFERLGVVEQQLTSSFLAMLGGPATTGSHDDSSVDDPHSSPDVKSPENTRLTPEGVYDALNELTAVFTPARWAYEDVVVRLQDDADSDGVGDQQGHVEWRTVGDQASANLRMNTAQLNTMTLAMFLLCAPRINNTLRLLILDDPFQGMDELTVSCVARGLGRLARIWHRTMTDPYRILLFLHGDESIGRLRHEIPATVHELPFHVPDSGDQQAPDKPLKPTYPTREPEQLKAGTGTAMAPLAKLLTDVRLRTTGT